MCCVPGVNNLLLATRLAGTLVADASSAGGVVLGAVLVQLLSATAVPVLRSLVGNGRVAMVDGRVVGVAAGGVVLVRDAAC